jgi:hypothetical protein
MGRNGSCWIEDYFFGIGLGGLSDLSGWVSRRESVDHRVLVLFAVPDRFVQLAGSYRHHRWQ